MFLWAAPSANLKAATLISLFTLILLVRQQARLGEFRADAAPDTHHPGPRDRRET
jgi:hypothetical protein